MGASGLEEPQEERQGEPSQRKRRYRSTLREERAAETRDRIVAAARELFATRGFAGSTMAGIAERAGVATPTVYTVFSSKGAIIAALIGDLEQEIVAERRWGEMATDPSPLRRLDLFAAFHRHLFSKGRDVWAAAMNAAGDPTVLELNRIGEQKAKQVLTGIVGALADAKLLLPDLTQQEAIDRAWMLTSMDLYFRATTSLDWSDDRYEEWLNSLLRLQLTGTARA